MRTLANAVSLIRGTSCWFLLASSNLREFLPRRSLGTENAESSEVRHTAEKRCASLLMSLSHKANSPEFCRLTKATKISSPSGLQLPQLLRARTVGSTYRPYARQTTEPLFRTPPLPRLKHGFLKARGIPRLPDCGTAMNSPLQTQAGSLKSSVASGAGVSRKKFRRFCREGSGVSRSPIGLGFFRCQRAMDFARVSLENESSWGLEKMRRCLALAREAMSIGEVPVGAVVAREGQILSQAYNLRETLNDPTAHAERLALTLAGRALGTWRLDGYTLFVTLEPCPMCAGAIVQSRMARVVYGANDPKAAAC